jgi:hypothetical protein
LLQLHLRPRVSTYGAATETPRRYSHRLNKKGLPSFNALNGKKELGKYSTPRLGSSTIARRRQQMRLRETDERVLAAMPPLTKRAQQLQQDFTRIIGRGLTRRGAWPT